MLIGFSREWALLLYQLVSVIVLQMKIESSHDAVHLTVFTELVTEGEVGAVKLV